MADEAGSVDLDARPGPRASAPGRQRGQLVVPQPDGEREHHRDAAQEPAPRERGGLLALLAAVRMQIAAQRQAPVAITVAKKRRATA